MKILVVCQYFWPEFFIINKLTERLHQRSHKVTVLTGLPNYPKGDIFEGYSFLGGPWTQNHNGSTILRVPLFPRKKGFFFLALNYLSFIFFGIIPGVFRLPKECDVIFCFGLSPITQCLPAIVYKWIYRKPLVFWVQDLWPESVIAVGATRSSLVLKTLRSLVRFIYSQCDLILVQSEAFHENIRQYGVDPKVIHYVPNWAQKNQSIGNEPGWVKGLPKLDFRIVFAGNLGKAQSLPTIIKAAELLRDKSIQFIIVGDGSEKSMLDQAIHDKDLGRHVKTTGRKPNEDMPTLFNSADALLVSLTSEHIFSLTVPSKVQAYMASGKPILASIDGEGARIVSLSQSGLTAPAEDHEKLAEIILKLVKYSPETRQKMGLMGQNYFLENFEEGVVVDKIEKLLKDIAK